jgi:hypothetical protein
MIGFVYSTGEDFGQIAVDFNEALGGGNEKGNIILLPAIPSPFRKERRPTLL